MAFMMGLMMTFVLVVLGLVMGMAFLVSAMEAVVMLHLAAVCAGFGRLLTFRIRVGSGPAACPAGTAALTIKARLGLLSADMADGVLLLGQREDVRIAAGLRGATIGVVLLVFFLVVGHVTCATHGRFSL
jgi:hypothetical protein